MPYWQTELLKITMVGREIWGFAPYLTWPSTVTSMTSMAMSARKQSVHSVDVVNRLRIPLNYHTTILIEASIPFMTDRRV